MYPINSSVPPTIGGPPSVDGTGLSTQNIKDVTKCESSSSLMDLEV